MKENLRFLIVDDDADDTSFLIEAVKEVDSTASCEIAKNGRQALELLKKRGHELPDFIFLDLTMPGLSGRRCLQEIKSDENLKHIPVFIYTVSQEVKESKELKEMGAVRFISKPSNPEEIYYIVSVVIEEHLNSSGTF